MRTLCWWSIVGAATLALLGCSTSSTPDPLAADLSAVDNDYFAVYTEPGQSVTANAGHFRMTIDTHTMTGEIRPVISREAQIIGDQYNLPINQFFAAFGGGFEVVSVGLDVDGNVVVGYTITHPFQAPVNLAQPQNALTNRADLAVSGRTVFMTPAPSGRVADESSALNTGDYEFTFGADTVIANTKVVKNADGYYNPKGMVNLANFPAMNGANAFPFKGIVNEQLNNRTSRTGTAISNGGQETGNYNPASGGWQNGNIGPNNDGWTGYGVLHQGQVAGNSIVFDPDLAVGGIFELDFVCIAKYIDPRGGLNAAEKRGNRLPSSDPANFAYRMPWGSQDLDAVSVGSLTLTGATPGSLSIAVVDYDFGATEDAGFPGAGGTNLDQIPVGTAGLAAIQVAGSDMFAGTVDVADPNAPDSGTGTRADPLTYAVDIANTTATNGGVDGGAYVMVRVADPEPVASPNPADYIVAYLDDQVVPAPNGNPAEPVVYQVRFVTTN